MDTQSVAPVLSIHEDNAGGLWLYGMTVKGDRVHWGDLAATTESGIAELLGAYHDGIEGWNNAEAEDLPLDEEPGGETVATYDGQRLILYPRAMGHAARRKLLPEEARDVLD